MGLILLIYVSCNHKQETKTNVKVIEEYSPSKSMYFDWININWYGGNENKVMRNL